MAGLLEDDRLVRRKDVVADRRVRRENPETSEGATGLRGSLSDLTRKETTPLR